MKTIFRIVIIMTIVLAVAGALYAVGQSEWAAAQLASDRPAMTEGAEGGRPMPDVSSAAATLGVTTEALTAAIGSFPPDYGQAAATLGLPVTEVQAALESSLGAMRGERGAGGEQGGGFNVASLATFLRILLPMAVVIAGVTALRALWDWNRRRNRQPMTAA